MPETIYELPKRSALKQLSSAISGMLLYAAVAHSVTNNNKQSLIFLGLGALEGVIKTVGAYKYERYFASLEIGRNAEVGKSVTLDPPLRSAFKIAGWFVLSSGLDMAIAYAATHDSSKAASFVTTRGMGRLALSYGLERVWSRVKWGVITNAANLGREKTEITATAPAPEKPQTILTSTSELIPARQPS